MFHVFLFTIVVMDKVVWINEEREEQESEARGQIKTSAHHELSQQLIAMVSASDDEIWFRGEPKPDYKLVINDLWFIHYFMKFGFFCN